MEPHRPWVCEFQSHPAGITLPRIQVSLVLFLISSSVPRARGHYSFRSATRYEICGATIAFPCGSEICSGGQ
jgi:hypothetical protein